MMHELAMNEYTNAHIKLIHRLVAFYQQQQPPPQIIIKNNNYKYC